MKSSKKSKHSQGTVKFNPDDIMLYFPSGPDDMLALEEDLVVFLNKLGFTQNGVGALSQSMINAPDEWTIVYLGDDLVGAFRINPLGKRSSEVHIGVIPKYHKSGLTRLLSRLMLSRVFSSKRTAIAKIPKEAKLARVGALSWGFKRINSEGNLDVFRLKDVEFNEQLIRREKEKV